MRIIPVVIVFSCITLPRLSHAQVPNSEYADKVVAQYYSNAYPYYTDFYGGEGFNFPIPVNVHSIEGANTNWFVSLPTGSYVVMEFTNNKIIDYPGQNDIFITENGCNNELAEVFVSSDGKKFTRLGVVDDCNLNSLDLATIGYKDPVSFVKVVGMDLNGGSPGFDLVNIKGLPGSSIEVKEDAVADSLDNLSSIGFTALNNENPSGKEWVLESEHLQNAQINLYDPSNQFVPLTYRSSELSKVVIDASGLKKGVYTLEIKIGSNVYKQKINIS
jgi:hypothetical protein